MTMLNA